MWLGFYGEGSRVCGDFNEILSILMLIFGIFDSKLKTFHHNLKAFNEKEEKNH